MQTKFRAQVTNKKNDRLHLHIIFLPKISNHFTDTRKVNIRKQIHKGYREI